MRETKRGTIEDRGYAEPILAQILAPTPDVKVRNEGSIFLIVPLTDEARAWLDENTDEGRAMFGGGTVVEPRYVEDLVVGMQADGLLVI